MFNVVRSNPVRGVVDTTLCNEVCRWFSPGTVVSSINKIGHHDVTEILLKVALDNIHPSTCE